MTNFPFPEQTLDPAPEGSRFFPEHALDSAPEGSCSFPEHALDSAPDGSRIFPEHTLHSAPDGSRRIMAAMARQRGHVPAGVARLASSPQLLDGFLKASGLFESTSLDPVAREVVIMTMATRNRCHICVAMHTAKLTALDAGPELVTALREQRPLPDERLAAIQRFTLDVVAAAGAVSPKSLEAFLGQGYTARNALEVVLGIGTYTMSTLANRLTGAPLDEQFSEFAWEEPVA